MILSTIRGSYEILETTARIGPKFRMDVHFAQFNRLTVWRITKHKPTESENMKIGNNTLTMSYVPAEHAELNIRQVVDLRRCLADEFQSACHHESICQKVEDLEISVMFILHEWFVSRHQYKTEFLPVELALCKFDMKSSQAPSTLWHMNLSCKADWNSSAEYLMK